MHILTYRIIGSEKTDSKSKDKPQSSSFFCNQEATSSEAQGPSALSTHHLHRDILTSGKLGTGCGASANAVAEKLRLRGYAQEQ